VLQSVPKFITIDNKALFEPSKCMAVAVLLGDCPKKTTVTAAYMDEFQRDAREAIATTARVTSSQLIDFRAQLCPHDQCSNYGVSGLMYRDVGHLNVEASKSLAAPFVEALRGQ
jgi:hypothetical protein